MIPIRDTVPSQHTPWVTRLLVLANVAVFVLELSQGPQLESFLFRFGLVPAYWHPGSGGHGLGWPLLATTFITCQFLHGSILHLGGNMLYLWIFGDNVEDRLGPVRFLLLYLGSGIAAGLAQFVMAPTSSLPMIGASGAIAGVLGAYLRYFPSGKIVTLIPLIVYWEFIEVPAFLFLGIWFVMQWAQGMTTIGQVADVGGVAWWAHVGGFATGFILSLTLRRRANSF